MADSAPERALYHLTKTFGPRHLVMASDGCASVAETAPPARKSRARGIGKNIHPAEAA